MRPFIMSLLLAFSFFTSTVDADEVTGYNWLKLHKSDREKLLIGYLRGYRLGYINGQASGMYNGAAFMLGNTLRETNNKTTPEEFADAMSMVSTELFQMEHPAFKHHYNYYAEELESFYQSFPLCKGKEYDAMIAQLIPVWLDLEVKDTYKEIGDRCLE